MRPHHRRAFLFEERSDERMLVDAYEDYRRRPLAECQPPVYDAERARFGREVLSSVSWVTVTPPHEARIFVNSEESDDADDERELTEEEWAAPVWMFGAPKPYDAKDRKNRVAYHAGMLPTYILVQPCSSLSGGDAWALPTARLVLDGCSVRDLITHVADMTGDMHDHVFFEGVSPITPETEYQRVVIVDTGS